MREEYDMSISHLSQIICIIYSLVQSRDRVKEMGVQRVISVIKKGSSTRKHFVIAAFDVSH